MGLCSASLVSLAEDAEVHEPARRHGVDSAAREGQKKNLSQRELEALVHAPLSEQLHPCELSQVKVYGGARVPRGPLSVSLPRRPALRSGPTSLIVLLQGKGAGLRLPVSAEIQCPAPAVQAGERVQLEVRRGAVRVTAPGRALQTGHVGEVVQVENTATRGRLSGRVTADNRVEVLP